MVEAATTPGFALALTHEKMRGAEVDCRRQGIAFLPMATESFEGWHPVAEREVRMLAPALSRHSVQENGEALRHLWGCLGILLQREKCCHFVEPSTNPTASGVNGYQ